MQAEWDESFLRVRQEDASIYWVWFWTGDDIGQAARHDPQRISDAEAVDEILDWIGRDRHFELFVEVADHTASGDSGRRLIRLAGDFRPAGTVVNITLTAAE
ncbi:hypothetical protein [Agromyces sp. NPDC055658]